MFALCIALSLRLYVTTLTHLDCGLLTEKFSILYKFDCFIHLPLLFIKFYSSVYLLTFPYIYILNITCLIKTFLGMAVEESHLEIGNTAFMVSFNFFFFI